MYLKYKILATSALSNENNMLLLLTKAKYSLQHVVGNA